MRLGDNRDVKANVEVQNALRYTMNVMMSPDQIVREMS